MPMLLPPKKITSIIMDRMSMPEGEKIEESATSERDYDIALEAACDDILTAVETKNVKLLMSAMKDFHSIYDEEMEARGYGPEEEEMERGE